MMCVCPDGSYANYGQPCRSYRVPPRQQVGDYCSNGGTCPSGSYCSRLPGRCVPNGRVDCGTYYCNPDLVCGRNDRCITKAEAEKEDENERKRQAELERKAKQEEEERKRIEAERQEAKKIVGIEAKQRTTTASRAETSLLKGIQSATTIRATKRYDQAIQKRDSIWKPMGVPSGLSPQSPNSEKVKHDWPLIQMTSASYSNKLKPGYPVFKNDSNWKVLDKVSDKRSGFQAYVVVNQVEARMVVVVRGSGNPVLAIADKISSSRVGVHIPGGRDAVADWKQDINAIARGKVPQQFSVTQALVQKMKDKHGKLYSIECAGHSLGGGACAYAAANVPGVHGVAINPISTGALDTRHAYLIDNYVISGEIAGVANAAVAKDLTGWKYQINPQGPAAPSLGKTLVDKHFVNNAINGIASELNLQRFELNDQ